VLSRIPTLSGINVITIHIRKHHSHINISIETYDHIVLKEIALDNKIRIFICSDNHHDKDYFLNK